MSFDWEQYDLERLPVRCDECGWQGKASQVAGEMGGFYCPKCWTPVMPDVENADYFLKDD
jgi:hypothetical protein